MTEQKLKPCPFCNSSAMPGVHWAQCSNSLCVAFHIQTSNIKGWNTRAAQPQAVESAATQWREGSPSNPWDSEWFLAQMVQGAYVVLRPLPEEYSYDFTTADGTYVMRASIKRWAQLSGSQYIEPEDKPKAVEGLPEPIGHLHRVLEDPVFYVNGDPHIKDGMPLYSGEQINAMAARISLLEGEVEEWKEEGARRDAIHVKRIAQLEAQLAKGKEGLPKYMDEDQFHARLRDKAEAYNAAIDECQAVFAVLRAENEQLSLQVGTLKMQNRGLVKKRDTLRATNAKLVGLLTEAVKFYDDGVGRSDAEFLVWKSWKAALAEAEGGQSNGDL